MSNDGAITFMHAHQAVKARYSQGPGGPAAVTPPSVEAHVRPRVYATMGTDAVDLDELQAECDEYWNVLLRRQELPVVLGVQDLHETAAAYLTRLLEMEALIRRYEENLSPGFLRGGLMNKFRTGELQSLIKAAMTQMDLGSRRITQYVAERRILQ